MASSDMIQAELLHKQSHQRHTSCVLNKLKQNTNIARQTHILTHSKKRLLNESEIIQQVRIRSLSHWPHIMPSNESLATAGWFSCNINDRVICIYCNMICHGWTSSDDPAEVHRRLSPLCPFVVSMPEIEQSPKIVNEILGNDFQPRHSGMVKLSEREATFSSGTWNENLPSITDFARAGFFFSGVSNTTTCFYCNGSLHKWGPNDNPAVEHARWFPQCTYIRHLCGDYLYGKIQMLKQCIAKENQSDETLLKRMVSARLDLPIAVSLRSKYGLSVVRHCLEDQLKIKNDDFASDMDFSLACMILQKQIDVIRGSASVIVIPSKCEQSTTPSNPLISKKSTLAECVVCLTEERQLACMPCGHLCVCVPCGYALHCCPLCRQKMQSFVKINM